jgi:hypothetical protein
MQYNISVSKEILERRHHVVGNHIRRRVHGERVEPARGLGQVQQRARPSRRHETHRRLGSIALGVEHDYRATLPAQILGHRGHQIA